VSSILVSPHLIDLILVFTVMEAIVIGLWHRHRSSGTTVPGAGTSGLACTVAREAGVTLETLSANRRVGPSPLARYRGIGLMLLPGIFLLMALRVALAGALWPWVPAALTAALVAHLLDLRQRWLG
jgi:hypothetical protein